MFVPPCRFVSSLHEYVCEQRHLGVSAPDDGQLGVGGHGGLAAGLHLGQIGLFLLICVRKFRPLQCFVFVVIGGDAIAELAEMKNLESNGADKKFKIELMLLPFVSAAKIVGVSG